MSELIQLDNLPVETLAEMANEAAAACEASGRKTVEHAIRCGRALLAAKAQVKHGEWLDWLEANFRHTRQHADRFIEIAKCTHVCNLEEATSIRDALRMIADSPEKQAKKAERQARKAEAPPTSLAPATPAPPASFGVIRHEGPPATQAQPAKPAWLADPDELDRPEEDDLPPLPKTSTHHTSANRRTPDARETDRANVVTVEESFRHGAWYEWSEPRQRMLPLDDYAICCRAEEISPPPAELATVLARHNADDILRVMLETRDDRRESSKEVLRLLKKMADELQEPGKSPKRFTKPTAAEVAAYATEIGAAIDAEQFCDFYESKDWMIGKNRMKDWRAAVRTWKRGQAAKPGTVENGKVRSANWEDDGTGWEDLRDG